MYIPQSTTDMIAKSLKRGSTVELKVEHGQLAIIEIKRKLVDNSINTK